MSKFKRSRDDKQTLNPIKEETIVHAADDVVIINHSGTTVSNETKTTSVMLTAEDASLLEQLSKLEDRSQRKIASRILKEGIRAAAKAHGLLS
jgi:hypothetical protein